MPNSHAAGLDPAQRPSPVDVGLTRASLLMLVILALVNMLNYFDRMIVVVVASQIKAEFDLSDTALGLLTGPAFVIIYTISGIILGGLADKMNRRRILAASLLSWSLLTSASGFAGNFVQLLLARAGTGIGEAGSTPTASSLIADTFPPARRGFAFGIFYSAAMLGLFFSFVLGSWIADLYGWRTAFLLAGVPGVFMTFVVLTAVKEPPRGRFDLIPAAPITFVEGLRRLKSNGAYVWLCVGAGVTSFGNLGIILWLPQFFIRSYDMTQRELGVLFGPTAALGTFSGLFFGGVLASFLAKRSLSAPAAACASIHLMLVTPLLLTVLWVPSRAAALVLTFVALFVASSASPSLISTVQNVCEPMVRGKAAALLGVSTALIGQGILPFFVGTASDLLAPTKGQEALRYALSFSTVFTLMGALMLVRGWVHVRRYFGASAAT